MIFKEKMHSLAWLWGVSALFLLIPLLLWIWSGSEKDFQPTFRKATAIEEVLPLGKDSTVWPVVYQQMPPLESLTVGERKRVFIALMLPTILIIKQQREQEQQKVEALIVKQHHEDLSREDSLFLEPLLSRYKISHIKALPSRLKTHPASLALAQAAIESGWGTSRFFAEANNIFGVWSFDPDEPRIPAKGNRGGKRVYLRKYDDVLMAVTDYFTVLGKGSSYARFREARIEGKGALQLIPHLKYYSELRNKYVSMLRKIIRKNNLLQYDHYRLHARYHPQDTLR